MRGIDEALGLAACLAISLCPTVARSQTPEQASPAEGATSQPSCEASSEGECAKVIPLPALPRDPAEGCAEGDHSACAELAEARSQAKDFPAAEDAWLRGCTLGGSASCKALGRRHLERGEFDAAEALLQRAHDLGDAEVTRDLSELRSRRNSPADRAVSAERRAESDATEKPDVEGVFQWRLGPSGSGGAFLLSVQPMAFWSRRINAGFYFAGGTGPPELDGFLGVQAFANELLAGYARVLVGSILGAPAAQSLNYGAEIGAKLCWGEIGHLEVSVGSSRASPMHASIGLGVNGIFLLALLLH